MIDNIVPDQNGLPNFGRRFRFASTDIRHNSDKIGSRAIDRYAGLQQCKYDVRGLSLIREIGAAKPLTATKLFIAWRSRTTLRHQPTTVYGDPKAGDGSCGEHCTARKTTRPQTVTQHKPHAMRPDDFSRQETLDESAARRILKKIL